MKIHSVSRRMFLQGGGLSLCVPFLPSLVRTSSAAPGDGPIRRLIILGTRYGWDQTLWFPSDAAVANATPVSERARTMPLADIAGDLSPIHTREIWGSLVDKMTLIDGFDAQYGAGHQLHYPLTTWNSPELLGAPTESLDVIIRDNAEIHDGEPLSSLHLAANGGFHDGESMSVVRSGGDLVNLPHLSDPAAAHDTIFEHVIEDDSQIEAFDRLKQRDLSVIDHVHADYTATRSSPRLSKNDKDKLDAYLQYLREYETAVEGLEPAFCEKPPKPGTEDDYGNVEQSHPERMEAQIANLVGAIRCGVTNVVTFSMMPTTPKYQFIDGFSHVEPHDISHYLSEAVRGDALAQQQPLGRYFAQQAANLLSQLDVVEDPETGRTFLDNSLVLWTNDMGSVANHKGARIPLMLLGGKDLLAQGQYVDFRSGNTSTWTWPHTDPKPVHDVGVFYNRLLETIAQAFGLTPEQYEQGPEAGFGYYDVSGYYTGPFGGEEAYVDYAFGDRRSALRSCSSKGRRREVGGAAAAGLWRAAGGDRGAARGGDGGAVWSGGGARRAAAGRGRRGRAATGGGDCRGALSYVRYPR